MDLLDIHLFSNSEWKEQADEFFLALMNIHHFTKCNCSIHHNA